jgi:hypothetical protein
MSNSDEKRLFADRDYDMTLLRWLEGDFNAREQEHWTEQLTINSRFREDFAECIKALREPSWGRESASRKSS